MSLMSEQGRQFEGTKKVVSFRTTACSTADDTSSSPAVPDGVLGNGEPIENPMQPDRHQSVPSEPLSLELVPETRSVEETTFFSEDTGVRLYVGPSCCRRGQAVGPVYLRKVPFLVHSGGSDFLVSTVVDCHPSGSTFESPLHLDFIVGDTLEEDIGAVELDEDLLEHLEDYKRDLLDDHKVRGGDLFGELAERERSSEREREREYFEYSEIEGGSVRNVERTELVSVVNNTRLG